MSPGADGLDSDRGPVAAWPLRRGEFWTAAQRQAHALHEVSYRACFKPQLPRYFIERCTQPGDAVYDPFSGRGTTALEAALLGRRVIANDVNPLSRMLAEPRLSPPEFEQVEARLAQIPPSEDAPAELDLSMFYHPRTEREILSLREYLRARRAAGAEDGIDRWIRMVATNRLTGHSPGFFSVYSFPPNQAVSAQAQRRINERRGQVPPYRDTRRLILKKSRQLLKQLQAGERERLAGAAAQFLERDAGHTPEIGAGAVQLTVTSPPFLDVVQYSADNWLRCWFNALDAGAIQARITETGSLDKWRAVMGATFQELHRVTRPGGYVAFEVGEVRRGTLQLENEVVPLGLSAGFSCEEVLINEQAFTKTSHIWGVANNRAGTNSNRIVLFRRQSAA